MATNDDKRVITIERAEHGSENPYFLYTRQAAQDRANLSYESIGMLAYILSRPDGWRIILEDLKTEKCGRDKVYRILRELKEAGYLKRELTFGKGHRVIGGRYVISETPRYKNQPTEKPEVGIEEFENFQVPENPLHGNLVTGNLTLHNTESQSTDSNTGTSYHPHAESRGNNTVILQAGNAVAVEQPVHKSNILVDTLPEKTKQLTPAAKTPKLPPSPMGHRAAPSMIPQAVAVPVESAQKVSRPWAIDEDGLMKDIIPPENGLSPDEQKEGVNAAPLRQPTPKEIARDNWTRAVLRQFELDQTFDYGADYKKSQYKQYVRDARLLRQASEDYMAKNKGVTIDSNIIDAMWGTKQNPGWLFRKDGKNLTRKDCSTSVLVRYFLEYLTSVSSPIVKQKQQEEKQALYANMGFVDPYADMAKFAEEGKAQLAALEAQRKAKKQGL